MKASIPSPLLVPLLMVAGLTQVLPAQDEDFCIHIVRPIKTAAKYHSSDVENWELMFDAKHPDGVKRIRLIGIGAKKPSEPWSDDYDPRSGYFYTARRFKGSGERKYFIEIETGKGEVVRSTEIYTLNRFAHADGNRQLGVIPEYQGFINLRDGDTVSANTPLYVGVDCVDPDGGFLVEDNRHKVDDLNGVLAVTLKIDGTAWKTKANSTEDPVGASSETAARSFGLYEFHDVTLSAGTHTLEIESTDREGNVRTGPSISVKAEQGGAGQPAARTESK